MKKKLFTIAFVLCSFLTAFSQATSLTIDCQTPGWLSSYINPSVIPTLRDLTVTGQINETDLATIGSLVKNYNLQGRLDLGDVDIVGDQLSGSMFGVKGCQLEYFRIPKKVSNLNGACDWVKLDTLVAGSSTNPYFGYHPNGNIYENFNYGAYYSKSLFDVKHLILEEGTTSIYMHGSADPVSPLQSITLPESLKEIQFIINFKNLSSINTPQNIEYLGEMYNTNIQFDSDTLYLPASVKTFWDRWANYNYRNAYMGNNTRNENGRIRCIYLPEGLETFWVVALHYGANVDIHIKAKNPPRIENGYFNSNTIVYVPVGYKDVYKSTGGGSGYTQWGGATILEEIYAERIDITSPDIMYVGDSYGMKVEFTPYNTSFTDVAWGVSDGKILSITQDGTCTALHYGEVQVIATNADRRCSDTKTINVYDHTTGINISESSLKLKIRERANLIANTLPLETSDGMITWSTDDESVATVDNNGNVKGVGKGTCTITATSVDGGYTAECLVTVLQPVETVTMEKHRVSLKVGESESLFAQIAPATADNKTILWSSSDEQLATVSKNGEVTALKAGTAWIKAVSEDNPEAKDSCMVTILQPVTGITLNYSTFQLDGIGSSFELEATIQPDDASNKNIKWKSSDESVCVVSNGVVVAVGTGTCVIIATTEDGGYLATCTVTVIINTSISSIDLNETGLFQVYDANGIRKNTISQGLNIICFADGTIKKVQIR